MQNIKLRLKRIEIYNKNPKICKHVDCNNIIPYNVKHVQVFCSHSCSAYYINNSRKKIHLCIECGKQIITKNAKKYCSKKCQIDHKLELKKLDIEKGFIKYSKTIKKYLIKEYGKICSVCKFKEWMGKPIPLDLDHIDGNSDNNLPINLRLICLNCHGQTPTWKAKNMGNGRKYRYKK